MRANIESGTSHGELPKLKPGFPEWIVTRFRRDVPLVVLDLTVSLMSYLAILVLRFEGYVPDRYWNNFRVFVPVAALIHVAANYLFGLYGQMWRYASFQEARRVVLSGTVGGIVVLGLGAWLGWTIRTLPFSVVLLGATFSLMGFGAIRFQSRLFSFRRNLVKPPDRIRAIIVGAGQAGSMLIKDLRSNGSSVEIDVVAALDDDPKKIGRSIAGVRVVGDRYSLPEVVEQRLVDQVLLTIPTATSDLVREIAALCEQADVTLRVLPSLSETLGHRVTVRDLRDLSIEDLLGRQQVETDLDAVGAMLTGRRVLVTGAGGSIGSEIAGQVLAFAPERLFLLDHDETHLHDLEMTLESPSGVESILADIRDPKRMTSIFLTHRPEVVFHAAAHKHVPVLENHPEEAVLTNVLGTANVADAAVLAGVERFVLISTDKAVSPVSVMGASKRFSEQIVRSLEGHSIFCAVRFGNVLGSRGSVIPTFLSQIEQGGPVTVTDESMVRYFMSAQEAVQLVLQAASLSRGGEVFTLDMGEPIRIIDLARKLIRLTGRVPGKGIDIQITRPRPGERLVEEIVDPTERPLPSAHPGILISRPVVPDKPLLRRAIRQLEILSHSGNKTELAEHIKLLAQNFRDAARTDQPTTSLNDDVVTVSAR